MVLVMELKEVLQQIKKWNEVSFSKKAIYKREKYDKNKKKRPICPVCQEYYLITVYIKFQEGGGRGKTKWVAVGKICPNCLSFFPYEWKKVEL